MIHFLQTYSVQMMIFIYLLLKIGLKLSFFRFFFYRPKAGHYGSKDIYPNFCPLPYHLGYVIIFICRYLFVFIFNSLPFHNCLILPNIILLYYFLLCWQNFWSWLVYGITSYIIIRYILYSIETHYLK